MKILARLRYATNSIMLILLNLNIFGFSLKKICAPGFVCHGCPWATFACPVGAIAYGFSLRMIPFYVLGTVLALGFLSARLICSWICPFGFLQDLLYKIPMIGKFKLPKIMRYGKYVILLFLVILLPFIVGLEPAEPYVEVYAVPAPSLENAQEMLLTQIFVTNRSEIAIKKFSLTVDYLDKDNQPLADFKPITKTFDHAIPAQESIMLDDFSIPSILGNPEHKIVLSSNYSRMIPAVKYRLYICNYCPLGELTAAIPNKVTRLLGGTESAVTISGDTPSVYEGHIFIDLRFSILVIFLILILLTSRPFCKMACPLGALFALSTPLSLYKIQLDKSRCINCGACDKVCPMTLDVRKEAGKMECIFCNNCIKKCPTQCISKHFGF